MAAIASDLGGSKATLYGYFPDKERLFAAVLPEALAEAFAPAHVLPSAPSLPRRLADLAEARKAVLEDATTRRWLALMEADADRIDGLRGFCWSAGPGGLLVHWARCLRDWLGGQDPDRDARQLMALCDASAWTGRESVYGAGEGSEPPASLGIYRAVADFLRLTVPPDTGDESDLVSALIEPWRSQMPGADLSSLGIVIRLQHLSLFAHADLSRVLQPYGIVIGDLDVLFCLLAAAGENYRLKAGDLARGCLVTTGAITGRLVRLAGAGLIERRQDAYDRRSVIVSLTAPGLDLAHRLRHEINAKSNFYWLVNSLPDHDRFSLNRLLTRLNRLAHAELAPGSDGPRA